MSVASCGCCIACDHCCGIVGCSRADCDHCHDGCRCGSPPEIIVERDRALAEQIVALIGRDSIGLPARTIIELCDKIGRPE